MKAEKILITGGCGFIGLNLVEYFLDKTDYTINILDNLSVGREEDLRKIKNYDKKRVCFYKGDIREIKDIKPAIKKCDFVVNLAAQTDVIESIKNPLFDAEVNIFGLINLLNLSKKHNIKRFIQASSAAPLGEQVPPVDEEKIPRPLSAYGASKLSCEGYCSAFSGSYNLKTVALRFSNVYGPYSYLKGSVVAKFIKDILSNKKPVIYGSGDQTRDFVHARDIANAIHLSIKNDDLQGFSLFQIGTGVETSINSLYEKISSILRNEEFEVGKPLYKAERAGEIYRNYCDISLASEKLGFKPEYSLNKGLQDTIGWFLSDKYLG